MTETHPEKQKTWTILELIRWATRDFTRLDLDSPRLDAELLLSEALACRRVDLYLRHDEEVGPEKLAAFRESVKRRRAREPVAYIIGKKTFRDIEIKVTKAVMIPRPETELLVDAVISCLKESGRARRILDIGTGSGAIALSIAKEFEGLEIWASDISGEALEVAEENAEILGLKGRINFIKGDRFQPFSDKPAFDMIVSNPPYIPTDVIPALMPEVRDFEPHQALDGGPTGLEFIFSILMDAPGHLNPGGWLWLEVGDDQARKVIMQAKSPFFHRETIKDYSGTSRAILLGTGPI